MTSKDNSYGAVMARKNEIMKAAVGVDYASFESGSLAFDYEAMMASTGYTLEDVINIQKGFSIGNTPLIELKNLTTLARRCAPDGMGARIFIKDEAATEIIEKARKCEALGAEVVQLTVGPELFYVFLRMLEDTHYFNASLYTTFGIAGIESLGWELAMQMREQYGCDPAMVVCTNAGGGNLTGTARGLRKAGCQAQVVAASVNLKGLHMASDHQFNLKSFTTGHTGFGMPFSTWPDRSDVPRSAARPLRYMDKYVTINQGEVFYITEILARLEGLEKGPAGNTSLAAAFALSQTLPQDQCIVVQETEYTGAGKHVNAQLSFARSNGIEIRLGNPEDEIPGRSIILPEHPRLIKAREADMSHLRHSLIKHAVGTLPEVSRDSEGHPVLDEQDVEFLALETNSSKEFVLQALKNL